MHNIKQQDLIKTSSFINGSWLKSQHSSIAFDVVNPANLLCLTKVHDAQATDAENAIEAASRSFPTWTKLTAYQRADHLVAWAKLISQHEDDLARLLTLEQGKPLSEALAEIRYGISYLHWFSEEGKRIYGDTIPALSPQQRILVTKQAVGVATAITPWNFPNAMLLRKAAAALAAGCTFVVKPASETPLSALALAYLAEQADLPQGSFNVVVGTDAKAIGEVLTKHPKVNKFSFTGSTETGKKLIAQCAEGVKKVSMELGGNAPFIVFDSADIDQAITGLISNKFRNAGQTCVCANRIYVQQNILDTFTKKLTQSLTTLKTGNGFDQTTNISPLISSKAVDKVRHLVNNAQQQGATIEFQGDLHFDNKTGNKSDCFYPATLLSGVSQQMEIAKTEIFGPVISLISFNNEDELIEQANATDAGLAAYFYSQNINQIWRVSEALQYGMVGINESALSNAAAPFGGVKGSGNGREGSHYGLDDYLEIKYLCFGGID
ncbi:NAD-dependent succinate-semialdehyde dehydrogenase [Psychromonas sp. RZ22]|uniref:NAD-dependent succinate-semialdehyde dehydrogenase n=1 Tax=Psychromonas algarum TaxID=2555643 RepID=UPI001067810E|nr:NAD-dependent succinate-semialdehyde dehydrogenase [Psychromonas sp. RZ22]TEW55960.1 NAD-dependent succinate-semialdehyde dehydrogenase [Psychromonas sp. RZ22]